MKQVKLWVYVLILYVTLVVVKLVVTTIGVYNGSQDLPFGIWGELGSDLLACLVDLVFAVFIGYIVELILREFTKKTLILNIIFTVILYELILFFVREWLWYMA